MSADQSAGAATGPRAVVRRDRKGRVDDVAVEAVALFRLERLDRDRAWVAASRGDERAMFSLWVDRKGRLRIDLVEDGLGCVDDTEGEEAWG